MTADPASHLRLALAQPRVDPDAAEEPKVDRALELIAEAGAGGCELLLFPEGYPGPLRAESGFDCRERLAAAARDAGCAVCWSRIERGEDGLHRKVAYLDGADGSQLLRYERAHPATGDVHPTLSGVSLAPGASLGLAQLGGVGVGVLICSELWLPEVARVLAVRGAEVLLAPAGGGFGRVAANWQLLARARAIENQCHLGLTQHLFGDERGSALIAGPETLVASSEEAGLIMADLDLQRARWLREHDDSMAEPKPFRSIPGLLRARRPGLYEPLSEQVEGLFDYEGAVRRAGM